MKPHSSYFMYFIKIKLFPEHSSFFVILHCKFLFFRSAQPFTQSKQQNYRKQKNLDTENAQQIIRNAL